MNKEEKYLQIVSFINQSATNYQKTILAEVVNLLYFNFENNDWVGFYEKDPNKDELFLSFYVGSEACEKININKGVCGKCYREKKTQVSGDVTSLPYHIACSSTTKSEIVVPVIKNDNCTMVLDIDSDIENAYDEIDIKYLEKICNLLAEF